MTNTLDKVTDTTQTNYKLYEKSARDEAIAKAKQRIDLKKQSEQAEKTKQVADSAEKAVVTTTATWSSKPEAKEVDTDKPDMTLVESQAARIEELVQEIENFKISNQELADKVEELTKKLSEANDTNSVLKEQIEATQPVQDLTSSAIVSTQVKTNVGALQDKLIAHVEQLKADVKTADEICCKSFKGEQKAFFQDFKTRIDGYLSVHNECQAEAGRNEVNLKQAIERRNAMANHGNSNKIYLQASDQSGKYLTLINYYHPKLTNLSEEVKNLQKEYETLAKDEFRDAAKFKEIVESLEKSTTQIEKALTKYSDQSETEKNDLLKKNYLKLSNTLDSIKALKTSLDKIPEDKKLSEIKHLFNTVEKEIEKTQKDVPDTFAAEFSIHSDEVKKGIKEELTKNNKYFNSIYLNTRQWASPLWNEIINTIKILEVELQLLGERSLLHDIEGSLIIIDKIKRHSNEDCDSIKNGQTLQGTRHKEDLTSWNDEQANIRKWHVAYTKLTDAYQSSLNELNTKIADAKAEGALKGQLDEYAINDFTKKDAVIADLIKTLVKQRDLITAQKAELDKKWNSLTQRILDTGNNLCVIDAGGWAASFTIKNVYRPLYNELLARPVEKKEEKVTAATNS